MESDDENPINLFSFDDNTPTQTDDPTTQTEDITRLIEIFSVVYLGHDELTPDKQLGTIRVNDNLNVHYLYNVDEVDMSRPSIQHGDQIMLTGPTIAPILGGMTEFYLDLFDGTYKDRMHFNCLPHLIEDQPLKRIITSKDGTGEICVLYSVFEDVISANVEFTLTNINSTAELYGVVAASTSRIQRPEFTSTLFVNKPEHKIKLAPGDRIPLSRSIIAVPLQSHLFLDVHLRDDKDDEIVKGSVEFMAQLDTPPSSLKVIGEKGQIEVNVNWKSAALTTAEKDIRIKNKLDFVLKFFCETKKNPDLSLSVYPL